MILGIVNGIQHTIAAVVRILLKSMRNSINPGSPSWEPSFWDALAVLLNQPRTSHTFLKAPRDGPRPPLQASTTPATAIPAEEFWLLLEKKTGNHQVTQNKVGRRKLRMETRMCLGVKAEGAIAAI